LSDIATRARQRFDLAARAYAEMEAHREATAIAVAGDTWALPDRWWVRWRERERIYRQMRRYFGPKAAWRIARENVRQRVRFTRG